MFVNSLLEPGFSRLSENRLHVRETVAKAKRELSTLSASENSASSVVDVESKHQTV